MLTLLWEGMQAGESKNENPAATALLLADGLG